MSGLGDVTMKDHICFGCRSTKTLYFSAELNYPEGLVLVEAIVTSCG